ncbi:MAG: hypothetical protein JOZ01_00465 [Candidatus Eremiobacteraeota bacterium]|nr:hypothetical protein [Candidatus Eremiobacteraeota bacterium]
MKFSIALATVCAVVFAACGGGIGSQSAGVTNGAASSSNANASFAARMPQGLGESIMVPDEVDPNETAAAAYCVKTKGVVERRVAVYGSNGSNPLTLASVKRFCQYTKGKGSSSSRIHILLSTLYTTKPTLAALAYILKPPSGSCQGNPATCYCNFVLGGSEIGQFGAGGGWYKKNSVDQTLEACVLPDISSIDSWGLLYHTNGIIRGIDLTKVMRYKYPGS